MFVEAFIVNNFIDALLPKIAPDSPQGRGIEHLWTLPVLNRKSQSKTATAWPRLNVMHLSKQTSLSLRDCPWKLMAPPVSVDWHFRKPESVTVRSSWDSEPMEMPPPPVELVRSMKVHHLISQVPFNSADVRVFWNSMSLMWCICSAAIEMAEDVKCWKRDLVRERWANRVGEKIACPKARANAEFRIE